MRVWRAFVVPATVVLATSAVAQNAFFAGLQHTATGQANLALANGRLTVGNIGSSGQDGVRIDLGSSRGFRAEWDPIDPGGTLPASSTLQFDLHGSLVSAPGSTVQLASAEIDNGATGHTLTPDFSFLGASTYLLDLDSGDAPVIVVPGHAGPVVLSEWPDRWGGRAACDGQPLPCLTFAWNSAIQISIPGTGTFSASELTIAAEGAPPVNAITRIDALASDVPSFTVLSEEVEMFELFHRSLGNSALVPQSGNLVISNIGSSGDDGYAVDLSAIERSTTKGIAAGVAVDWAPIGGGGPLPAGAELTLAAKLSLGGIPSTAEPLLTFVQAGAAPPLDVLFDLSTIQAQSYQVEVRLGGVMVAIEGGIQVDGVVTDWPGDLRIQAKEPPFALVTYTVYFDSPTTFSLPGIGSWSTDEVRFGIEGTANTGAGLFDARVRAAHLPLVTIVDETPDPALPPFSYCTGKANSCAGTPSISAIGSSSASATSGFVLVGSLARTGKAGLVMYTDGGARVPAAPFLGGVLCIENQVRRSEATFTQGGTPGMCDATLSLDMNNFAAGLFGGNPQPFLSVPGTQVDCQWWGRDTVANGSYLSNALQYVVAP